MGIAYLNAVPKTIHHGEETEVGGLTAASLGYMDSITHHSITSIPILPQLPFWPPRLNPLLPRPSPFAPSKRIPKLQIPSIRHIRKLNIDLMPLPPLPQDFFSSLILPNVIALQAHRERDGGGTDDEDGNLGWDVVGRGALGEGQGADDVAHAEGDEEEGVHCDLSSGVSG